MKSARLTIRELRHEAYLHWETTAVMADCFIGQTSEDVDEATAKRLGYTNETFKSDVRKRFGDLRRRDTWRKAAIAFCAQAIVGSYFEPHQIVGLLLSPQYMRDRIRQVYGLEVVESVLQWPGIDDVIREGLATIFGEPEVYAREWRLVERAKSSRENVVTSSDLWCLPA